MNLLKSAAIFAILASSSATVYAHNDKDDSFLIPQRAVIVTGDSLKGKKLIEVLYTPANRHFRDPSAPRFLLLDREGKVAFGIGGSIKGTASYDFCGAIDQSSFITYDIPVPKNPALRDKLNASINNSSLFMQLVGSTEHFGNYQMYVQTYVTNLGDSGFGLRLRYAYLSLGYVTAGLTSSTFVDGNAGVATIDNQGPCGELYAQNVLVQYNPHFGNHWSAALSVEMPKATYTLAENTESLNQRVPDIPAYIQYAWGKKSHIRLSALYRNLSYRDLASGKNRFVTGWAAQLSGVAELTPALTMYYQGIAGKGYGRCVNDFAGNGLDLIPDGNGRLKAPTGMNFEIGFQYEFSPKAFIASSYSQARLYGQHSLGSDAYRYGQYVSMSGFYNIVPDLQIGLEYLYGNRADINHVHNHANRINAMLKFSF